MCEKTLSVDIGPLYTHTNILLVGHFIKYHEAVMDILLQLLDWGGFFFFSAKNEYINEQNM